jgi:hypothetical protein
VRAEIRTWLPSRQLFGPGRPHGPACLSFFPFAWSAPPLRVFASGIRGWTFFCDRHHFSAYRHPCHRAEHPTIYIWLDRVGTFGIGGQSWATVAPASLTFSSTKQGSTSAAQTVTLTSSGTATLHISSVAMNGANPGDFAMVNGCSGPAAADASCNISVKFSPLAGGVRTAFIAIADDARGSPQSAPITQGVPTPAGTSTISVTPTATSTAGTPLAAIAPIQLTLTVN